MMTIPLSRGRYVALVDDEDHARISEHRWHHKNGYAVRWTPDRTRRLSMHREVLGFPDARYLDHANGNPLDNRRTNLRICTAAQNSWNSRARGKRFRQFKGVQCRHGRWRTRIRIKGWLTHVGSFSTELEAALAYDRAARQHFGKFACVNFPFEGERPALAS